MLITAAGTVGTLERIGEMEGELTKVIEDFDRAVDVTTLRHIKAAGKYLRIDRRLFVLSGLM